MSTRHLLAAVTLGIALAVGACAAHAGDPGSAPTEVLVGTEIGDLGEFPAVPIDDAVEGTFTTETGGARQTIDVAPTGDGTWRIERQVVEPGEAPFRRTYQASIDGGALRSQAGDMELRLVAGGVLILETGDDIVPPDMWTFYARE